MKEMKYLFLLKIKVPKYKWFIELGKNYRLKVHPNIKDKIWVDDFFCSITEILYNVDNDLIHLKLNVDDPIHSDVENSEEAIERLRGDINELKIYDWYINDYDLGNNKENLINDPST